MMGAIRILLAAAVLSTAAGLAAAPNLCAPEWKGFRPPDSQLQICWNLGGDILHVEMSHPGQVWIALGFGQSMAGADAVIGRPETGEVTDVLIGGYDADSIVPDTRQDIKDAAAVFDDGRTMVKFSRALDTGDDADQRIITGRSMPVIWAVGNSPGFSGHYARGAVNMNWGEGAAFLWSTPTIMHAVLMVVAWLLVMPAGVIIARYYKVLAKQDFPKELDNQFWWHWHLALQYGGMLLAVAGFLMVWDTQKSIGGGIGGMHAIAGIAAMTLGVLQIISGILRGSKGGPVDDNGRPNPPEKVRGDHYDMTLHRRIFEAFHKNAGYAALAAGCVAALLGLWQTGAHWILYAAFFGWLCAAAIYFVRLQKSGRWTDTYQAIWGPDVCHPGNSVRALGNEESENRRY